MPLTRVQDVLHRAYLANSHEGIAIQKIFGKIFTGYTLAVGKDIQKIYGKGRRRYTDNIRQDKGNTGPALVDLCLYERRRKRGENRKVFQTV